MIRSLPCLLLASGLLAACDTAPSNSEPEPFETRTTAPPGAAPGSCWGKDITPAVVETVTEQVLLRPAETHPDGRIARPATYKTETRQKIVQERAEAWFETPCAEVLTPEFVASLQRALRARGYYRGPISGQMDARTRAAIRRYQAPQGLNSAILSIATARKLGLVAVEIEK